MLLSSIVHTRGGWTSKLHTSVIRVAADEFIDTYVLILKGKEPSLLQLYHHAGIAITMWGSTVTNAAWIAWVVVMNSTVHTLMSVFLRLLPVTNAVCPPVLPAILSLHPSPPSFFLSVLSTP